MRGDGGALGVGSHRVDHHNGCSSVSMSAATLVLVPPLPAEQGAGYDDVLAGTWHDPYTVCILRFTDLKEVSQAVAIQIDHVVPLARRGCPERRAGATTGARPSPTTYSSRSPSTGPPTKSKGDGDPRCGRPRKGYQCAYAKHWIAIKTDWHLTAHRSKVAALADAGLLPLSPVSVSPCPAPSRRSPSTTPTRWPRCTSGCCRRRTPA